MRILVTGATGAVGGHVARQLSGRGHEIVALVRDPAKADLPADISLLKGDLTDAEAVRAALSGVDRAFLNMADDNGAVFAAVAGELGLAHVVLLSSFTAVTDLPPGADNIVSARHQAGERALTEAGVPATFLRAAGFDYNILLWTGGATGDVVEAPNADVRLPIVDPADIAATAVAVLVAADPVTGPYMITGPALLSVRDQIAVVNEVLGRSFSVREISETAAAKIVFPEGTPELVTTSILATMGPAAAHLAPTGDVEALTGRPPRTFAEWVADNQAAF